MSKQINELAIQAGGIWRGGYVDQPNGDSVWTDKKFVVDVDTEQFARLILANADELKRGMNTNPINKPFELNPKFVAKCDEIGRSRRQFQ
jgi:hypothetical protein